MNASKTCNACEIPQPPENFYRHKTGKLRAVCKSCMKAQTKIRDAGRYARNPAQAKARVRRWRKKNPERVRTYARQSQRRTRQRRRNIGQNFLNLP